MSAYQIYQFTHGDIWFDPDAIGAEITRVCRKHRSYYRLAGVVDTGVEVLFIIEPDPAKKRWEYVLKPFPSCNVDEVVGEIQARWQGYYSTRGYLYNGDELWGIFEREQPSHDSL